MRNAGIQFVFSLCKEWSWRNIVVNSLLPFLCAFGITQYVMRWAERSSSRFRENCLRPYNFDHPTPNMTSLLFPLLLLLLRHCKRKWNGRTETTKLNSHLSRNWIEVRLKKTTAAATAFLCFWATVKEEGASQNNWGIRNSVSCLPHSRLLSFSSLIRDGRE